MSRPKRKSNRVSVVIRTKDRPQLLGEALASLAAQTHEDLEAVVVNDGGEDVSAVIDAWRDRVDIIHEHLDPGRGRCAAANRGIELATGEWLAFLDDDDVWLPDGVARLVAELGAGEGVVYGRVGATAYTDGDDGESGKRFQTFGRPFDADALMFENFIPIIGCLLPLNLVREAGGFDEDLECFEDWDLFLKLSPLATFTYVDAEVAEYRIFGDGFITGGGGQERQHAGRTQIYTKHWDRLSPDPDYDGALGERHAAIMECLPFGEGLTAARLAPMLEAAGFTDIRTRSHEPIARAQRRTNGLRNRLRTRVYDRFILTARKG